MPGLTQEKLKAVLKYDPSTGLFTWIARTSNRIKVGATAGSVANTGYIEMGIFGTSYLAHRLAWLYMTGEWPPHEVDHKNCVRTDNRWNNLRSVTRLVNSHNFRSAHSDSQTGFLGVRSNTRGFQAIIMVSGKRMYLGTYETPILAHAAYVVAKRKFHEGCTL